MADVRTYERSHFHVSQTARDPAILGILPVSRSFQMTDPPHRQRASRLCLACTRHPAALALPLVFVHANTHKRFSVINCISEPSTRQRNNRFISILSRHVFCLLMTGHQPFSSLNYLCSEAAALSHFVLTGLSISRTNERERMRMKMWLTV